MNFFNSIFSEDPELSDSSESPPTDPADSEFENPNSENPNPVPESGAPASAWNFSSLVKTITTRSESVIGTYRRDFEEFGSGLLKETALIRDVASRAVKEFPDSIDAGAAVAQESLESVGQAIDNLGSSVWKGTNKILARGKELHLFDDSTEADDDDIDGDGSVGGQLSARSLGGTKYSWFDTRMREIQADPRTYIEDPDDLEDYGKWKSGFLLDEKDEEIQKLMAEERLVERIYLELVPVTVDKENFWNRYFYKVEKLQQVDEARARVVKRAIAGDDEEDLSWDVDEEGDEEDNPPATNVAAESSAEEIPAETSKQDDESSGEITEVRRVSDASETNVSVQEGKASSDSCKDSDMSIISRQPSLPGEEELEWDEIDDVGSGDDNKARTGSSSNISDLHKRLSAAGEEEDLSWDIEDDDEPIKS